MCLLLHEPRQLCGPCFPAVRQASAGAASSSPSLAPMGATADPLATHDARMPNSAPERWRAFLRAWLRQSRATVRMRRMQRTNGGSSVHKETSSLTRAPFLFCASGECVRKQPNARARACDAAQAHPPDRSTRCVRSSAALGHCTSVSEIAAAHRPGLGRARLLFGCGPLHTLSVRGAACNAELVQRTTRATQTSCNICTTCNGRHEMHTMLGTTRHGQQEMHTTRRTAIGAGTARCSAAHHRAVRVQF